jgi:DNA replication protein DnaC
MHNRHAPPDHEKDFFARCVPEKFREASLESCDKHPKSFIDYSKEWAKSPKSVILMGPPGRGKTYFAFAMIREAMRHNRRFWPKYLTSHQLDSKLLAAIKSDEGDSWCLNDISNEFLLFIDDFGRETRSERISRQYFELINNRYANNLPTIISTNLTIEMVGSNINEAIASRFQEWQTIEFSGSDLRVQNKIS